MDFQSVYQWICQLLFHIFAKKGRVYYIFSFLNREGCKKGPLVDLYNKGREREGEGGRGGCRMAMPLIDNFS